MLYLQKIIFLIYVYHNVLLSKSAFKSIPFRLTRTVSKYSCLERKNLNERSS